MCGLVGYYCFGDKRPSKAQFIEMLIACSERGTDATGLSFFKDGQLMILKQGVEAREFVTGEHFQKLEMPKTLCGHTRHGTGGAASDNRNNHPIYSHRLAISHNGIINNADGIFKKHGWKRDGQVDSEVILRAMEAKLPDIKAAVENTSILSGSMAVSTMISGRPDLVVLFRHSNPLTICYDKDDDILYWGSTKEIIEAGFFEIIRGFIFPKEGNRLFSDVEDNYCYIIEGSGLTKVFKFFDYSKVEHLASSAPLWTGYEGGSYHGRGYDYEEGSTWDGTGWKKSKKKGKGKKKGEVINCQGNGPVRFFDSKTQTWKTREERMGDVLIKCFECGTWIKKKEAKLIVQGSYFCAKCVCESDKSIGELLKGGGKDASDSKDKNKGE